MRTSILFIALILISGFAVGQKQNLKPFNAIKIFGPFEVEFIPSDKEAIEMDLFNVDKEDVTVEVHRGELELKLKGRHYLTGWDSDKFRKATLIKTKIYFNQLEEVDASAGAQVSASETLHSKRFIISGSMGAEIKLNVVAETMHVKSTMGAVVNLNGQTDFLEVKASMGGVMKASHLESKSAYVKASMGSEVSIFASNEIDIEANFGSEVRYSGRPSVRHTNSKMGADIDNK